MLRISNISGLQRDLATPCPNHSHEARRTECFQLSKGDYRCCECSGHNGQVCGNFNPGTKLLPQSAGRSDSFRSPFDSRYCSTTSACFKSGSWNEAYGAAQTNISPKDPIRDPGSHPPLPEQRRIVARIEELFSRLDAGVAALRHAKAQLQRYRQSVLAAAVTGQLTEAWREQHPDTEPAEELLERILSERRKNWNGQRNFVEPAIPQTLNRSAFNCLDSGSRAVGCRYDGWSPFQLPATTLTPGWHRLLEDGRDRHERGTSPGRAGLRRCPKTELNVLPPQR